MSAGCVGSVGTLTAEGSLKKKGVTNERPGVSEHQQEKVLCKALGCRGLSIPQSTSSPVQ